MLESGTGHAAATSWSMGKDRLRLLSGMLGMLEGSLLVDLVTAEMLEVELECCRHSSMATTP